MATTTTTRKSKSKPRKSALTLVELAEAKADRYEALGSEASALLAQAMRELGLNLRLTEATTAANGAARLEVLDDGIRAEWEAIGFEAGAFVLPLPPCV